MNVSSNKIAACVLTVASLCSHAQVIQAPAVPLSGSGSGLSMQFYCDEFEALQNVRQVALASQAKVKVQAVPGAKLVLQSDAGPVAVKAAVPTSNGAQTPPVGSHSTPAAEAEGPDPEIMAGACRMMRILKADNKSHYMHGHLPRPGRR